MRSPLSILLYRLSIMMLLFSFCRILFYLFNTGLFPGVDFHQLGIMMLGGMRFDLSAILYINLLYTLLQLIPFKFRHKHSYQKPLDYFFYITNAIGIALNCIDFIYYRFTLRRTTVIVFEEFKNEQNYLQLAYHFLHDYYYILFLWIVLIIIMVFLTGKLGVEKPKWSGIKYYGINTLWLILLPGLMVIGLRSGLPPKQDFPLVASDAGQYTIHPNDVAIVLNTPFCMLRTIRKPGFKSQHYFNDKELESIYSPIHHPDSTLDFKPMNIVVLIVESLGKETLGCYNRNLDNNTYKGYTPFLDSLAGHSLVFFSSYANGRISIEGSVSILASIPSLEESFSHSFYSGNEVNSLASCLSKKGYQSVFAHGAPNGSMGLNAFAVQAGFNTYIGKDEYGNNDDYDGVWGIWDHKFLHFFAIQCSKLKQPFLASVFTTSSHHPYVLPDELTGKFEEGTLSIHKSIRYTDYSIRRFFDTASKQPWFMNTIFIITGDHTCTPYHKEYKTTTGAFGVPLIFYTPGKQLLGKEYRIAQQIDIMPTLLNYLGYDKPYFAFGKDLLDPNTDNIAVNYTGNTFQLIWDNWVIQHNMTNTVALFDLATDPLQKNNLIGKNDEVQTRMERKVKAFIQQYNNRMIENRLLADPIKFSTKR